MAEKNQNEKKENAVFVFLRHILTLICCFLLRIYVYIVYKPKALCIDKSIQSNKFSKPTVIIANHTSYWDPPFMLSIIHGKHTIVVAKDWFEKKSIKWMLLGINAIPCDRFSMDTDWIMYAKNAIKSGKSVIIFPEGKTRKDGQLNEFKSGFAFLAKYTKVPVVSIGLTGSYKVGKRTNYVVGLPQTVKRNQGIPSSQDLAQQSENFKNEVALYKKCAIEGKLSDEIKLLSQNKGAGTV